VRLVRVADGFQRFGCRRDCHNGHRTDGGSMLIETRVKGTVYSVLIDGIKSDITIFRDTSGKEDVLTCQGLEVDPASSFNGLCENIGEALAQ